MEKIRVMIVEDDADWIKEISFLLNSQEDIFVTATAMSGAEAVSLAKIINPDVVLMDINLEGNKFDGIHTAAEIRQASQPKIIMLTSMNSEEIIRDAFLAGAVNYVTKNDYLEIPKAIRKSLSKENPMEILIKEYQRLKENEHLSVLSASEREVFDLIKDGLTNSEIEKKLYKSKNTLKNQISNIFKKLGVSNRKEAVRKIKSHGLLHDNNR